MANDSILRYCVMEATCGFSYEMAVGLESADSFVRRLAHSQGVEGYDHFKFL